MSNKLPEIIWANPLPEKTPAMGQIPTSGIPATTASNNLDPLDPIAEARAKIAQTPSQPPQRIEEILNHEAPARIQAGYTKEDLITIATKR